MRKKIEVKVTGKVIGFAYDDETDAAASDRIVLEAERHGNDGSSRIHLAMADSPQTGNKKVVPNKKASKVHWDTADSTGALCATKSTNSNLTMEGLQVTCKRCLALMQNKTLHPAPLYSVVLKHCGPNRIAVVRVIRERCKIGLKEAKELTDGPYYGSGPVTIASGLSKDDAFSTRQAINDIGGTAYEEKQL